MIRIFLFVGVLLLSIISCSDAIKAKETDLSVSPTQVSQGFEVINTKGKTVGTRFNVPKEFVRISDTEESFVSFLQNVPLKPVGTQVRTYDGEIKNGEGIYVAVVDLPIGKRDLHQCADAVMRLRMDYLYANQRYDEIHFNFTNGFQVDYSEYMKGKRMVVSGNKTYWKQSTTPSNTEKDFTKYKELIYSYAGTLSLSRELKPIAITQIQIGDVFIQGGSPGHAVIVIDMAINSENNKKLFLLAQSYMPAQEIQILVNPMNETISPWYSTKNLNYIQTPEWSFETDQLMRF